MAQRSLPAQRGPVSGSAPPPFRSKKPALPSSVPQNKDRLTGAPPQRGAGVGSMFANGRPPQGMAPQRPGSGSGGLGRFGGGQAQGGHPRGVPTSTHMMADGGFGAPPSIGDAPPDPDQDATPDMDDVTQQGGGELPVIHPEAVNYHDDAQNCGSCQFMGDGGQCAVLQMQVSPEGACNAFSPKMEQDHGGGDTGAGFAQNDAGTSGAPHLA